MVTVPRKEDLPLNRFKAFYAWNSLAGTDNKKYDPYVFEAHFIKIKNEVESGETIAYRVVKRRRYPLIAGLQVSI